MDFLPSATNFEIFLGLVALLGPWPIIRKRRLDKVRSRLNHSLSDVPEHLKARHTLTAAQSSKRYRHRHRQAASSYLATRHIVRASQGSNKRGRESFLTRNHLAARGESSHLSSSLSSFSILPHVLMNTSPI
jgi:hypothetical protein